MFFNTNIESGENMNFCWCTISVHDLEESLTFYTDIVGLTIERRFASSPGVEIAFLGDMATKVELICDKNQTEKGSMDGVSLGFEVKSLDEKMAFVKEKGLLIDSGPIQPNPHVKFFFVKDPNGLKIQFVENI